MGIIQSSSFYYTNKKCLICSNRVTDNIFLCKIYHKGKYDNRVLCSECLEDKFFKKFRKIYGLK